MTAPALVLPEGAVPTPPGWCACCGVDASRGGSLGHDVGDCWRHEWADPVDPAVLFVDALIDARRQLGGDEVCDVVWQRVRARAVRWLDTWTPVVPR